MDQRGAAGLDLDLALGGAQARRGPSFSVVPRMYTLRLDADDLLLEPLEPAFAGARAVDRASLPGSGPWPSLSAALEVALDGVEAPARVLTFEPSRADMRAAFLARGNSYVDGGRLLDGRPDPAAARRVLAGQ